jgi:[acyl-carrier-protein] S-malonyltransferase
MQNAYIGAGAMIAIVGLDNDMVEKVCRDAQQEDVLVVANYNSIGQTVLAGHLTAAHRAVEIAKIRRKDG